MLSYAGSAPSVKECCLYPEIYRRAFFQGSDLGESIHIEMNFEEQRITFVGGLQERCDLTSMDSCENKGFRHQKMCNNSPCPSLSLPLKVLFWNALACHPSLCFQFSSVAQSCLTLCDLMNRSTPGFPVYHQLLEFTQTHVHWVSDAIQPSHPLLSLSPPAPNPSQHQGLFQRVSSSHQVAKVLEFQLQHESFQWTPRTDLL